MIQLFKMAFRDLGRNRRRSFFSALALGIGLALLLLMAAVIAGEMRGSMETRIKLQSGHLQVRAQVLRREQDQPGLGGPDREPRARSPRRSPRSRRCRWPRRACSPAGSWPRATNRSGVRIVGIDPASAGQRALTATAWSAASS